jgi:hypothetical protein
MSPVGGILAAAALFAIFGLVRRERQGRCGTCTPEARSSSRCVGCPFLERDHD